MIIDLSLALNMSRVEHDGHTQWFRILYLYINSTSLPLPPHPQVSLRIAARRADGGAKARCSQFAEEIRRRLGWAPVPILRNRRRALVVIESPFDEFGPEGPPTVDDYLREELNAGAVQD